MEPLRGIAAVWSGMLSAVRVDPLRVRPVEPTVDRRRVDTDEGTRRSAVGAAACAGWGSRSTASAQRSVSLEVVAVEVVRSRRMVSGTSVRSTVRLGVVTPRARAPIERVEPEGASRDAPASKLVRFVWTSPRVESERGRAAPATGSPRASSCAMEADVASSRFGRNSSGTSCFTGDMDMSPSSADKSARLTPSAAAARKLSSVPLGRFGRPVRISAPRSMVLSIVLVGVRVSSSSSASAVGILGSGMVGGGMEGGGMGALREAKSDRGVRASVAPRGVRSGVFAVRPALGVRTVDGGVS